MRKFVAVAGFLLIFCAMSGAMLWAQETPPGSDALGADRYLSSGDVFNVPSDDAAINARISHTEGSTTGYASVPAFAGNDGYDSRSNRDNASAAGQADENGTVSTRLNTSRRNRQQNLNGGLRSGDNGSVWESNVTRASNIAAQQMPPTQPTANAIGPPAIRSRQVPRRR